jgi:hypothetical protein
MSIVHRRRIMQVARKARGVGLSCAVVAAVFVVGVEVITVAITAQIVVQDAVVITVAIVVVSAAVDAEVIVVVVAVAVVASGCWFVKVIRNIMTRMVLNAIIGKDSLLRNVLPLFALHRLHSLPQWQ